MTKKSNDPSQPDFENATQDDLLITEAKPWNGSTQDAENEDASWVKKQKQTNILREMWVIGWIVPALMIFVCILFVIFLGSWSWHFFGTERLHWLDAKQIDKIESTIFSGTLGAVVSIYFRGKVNKPPTFSDTTSQSE